MKKEERILIMLSEADEKYIMEAAPGAEAPRKSSVLKKAAVIAACLCLALAIGKLIAHFRIAGGSSDYLLPLSVSAAELGMEEYMFGVSLPEIVYADSQKVILYDFRGIYVYNIEQCKLTGFADFRPIDMTLIQGSDPTCVCASADGKTVRFYNDTKKYVYDTDKNETVRVDQYEEPFAVYMMTALGISYVEMTEETIADSVLVYQCVDGRRLGLDLKYDGEEIVRYKNLVLRIKDGDGIREYEIFK